MSDTNWISQIDSYERQTPTLYAFEQQKGNEFCFQRHGSFAKDIWSTHFRHFSRSESADI